MANGADMERVNIPAGTVMLEGELASPDGAKAVVIFVHGSGSSRHSARNKYVAGELRRSGLATLLFDLLTEKEDEVYETRFNIGLLTGRLMAVTAWVREQPRTKGLAVGYFGASTGAAAALQAAALMGDAVKAVVSRGGRPDLTGPHLAEVTVPTLLIVGGADDAVIGLNNESAAALRCIHETSIVPGATHLFEEPGTLEEVARLAAAWFTKYL
jgi:putative phosphoribosyl transferase